MIPATEQGTTTEYPLRRAELGIVRLTGAEKKNP